MRIAVLGATLVVLSGCAPSMHARGFGGPGGPPGFSGPPMRGRLFISPMGEPFRAREAGTDLIGQWLAAADRDRDGALARTELEQDAARFFAVLDADRDGEIEPIEMDHYEREIAPEIQLGSQFPMRGGGMLPGDGRMGGEPGGGPSGGPPGGGRGGPPPGSGRSPVGGSGRESGTMPQGAALFGLLDYPQPVAAADANLNRGVSGDEFLKAAAQRFVMLDKNGDGLIRREELPVRPPMRRPRP